MSVVGCSYWGWYLFPVPIALQEGSTEAPNEQLGHDSPDPHSVESHSETRNRWEDGDLGSGVRQLSETVPELTLGGSQDGGDAHDLVRSGSSGGKAWCSDNTLVRIDRY